jgi:hypothetical protein
VKPKVADSLAGRMEVINLLPLSLAEVGAYKPKFIERATEGELPKSIRATNGRELMQEVLMGGYPQMRALDAGATPSVGTRIHCFGIATRRSRCGGNRNSQCFAALVASTVASRRSFSKFFQTGRRGGYRGEVGITCDEPGL